MFLMSPNTTELGAMNGFLGAHCKITNTLLETSRLRYKAGMPAYNLTTACQAVKAIRNSISWIERHTTAQSVQVTAVRVVRAFERFFDRVARGETPGYPRFKSIKRFTGWGYKQYGDGWSLLQKNSKIKTNGSRAGHSYGAVRLTGIGTVSLRGRTRFEGEPITAEVLHRGGKWYLSVTFEVTPEAVAREGGRASMAFDWGVSTLLTKVVGDPMTGQVEAIDNPCWLKKQLDRIAEIQQAIAALEKRAKAASGKQRGFPVCHQLKNAYRRRRCLHAKIANQRHDFYHQLTAKLVKQYGLIATEELEVSNMARAPRPKEDPGNPGQYLPNGAASKAGLNRSILDAAPAGFVAKLRTKAEEAGSRFQFVPTRELKPTQRCHLCGETTKLELKDRQWKCTCGATHQRDENAARTILRYVFEGAWWKDTTNSGLERPRRPRAARNSIQVGSPIWME
ncbi:RNA-guided endonuclease InsQ/TnpB family protein [Variovorax sp. JS1663]|uniref:RNA-guided endonuclease InsQ/TnpB family protein n=1 Tax=Variovorax sp. JS1663 TaxID=1851577 RepID=UPI000B344CC2|nr:RNA-guided endonuclease TnpB family protein [Variovorax sp. JS1663]OUM00740.1 hypothetical protein A8M77_19840 [Variovorax sp. JS1663]